MNKKELNDKIADLEKQIEELKQVKVDEEGWKPKHGEVYYFFGSFGKASANVWYDDNMIDKFKYLIGNCFATKEEAEEFGKKLTTQLKFKKYVQDHSEPLDWANSKQAKWYVLTSFEDRNIICFEYTFTLRESGTIYASSKEILSNAIDYIGEDNAHYLFE